MLSPDEAAFVLETLRSGAGGIASFRADFLQEKKIPETGETLAARGSMSLRAPDELRWEYSTPVRSGFNLRGNSRETWSEAGGKPHAMEPREDPGGGDAARFIIACLAFDEQALGRFCALEVVRAAPPTVRLVPKNDFLRAHLNGIVLTFSDDGTLPRTMLLATADGGDTLFTFSPAARDGTLTDGSESLERVPRRHTLPEGPPEEPAGRRKGGGMMFSALLTESNRKLPLVLYVWRTETPAPALHCAVFTEILLRLGGVALRPGEKAAVTAAAPDARVDRILARVGEALADLFPRGTATAPRRYAGGGWSLDLVAVEALK